MINKKSLQDRSDFFIELLKCLTKSLKESDAARKRFGKLEQHLFERSKIL